MKGSDRTRRKDPTTGPESEVKILVGRSNAVHEVFRLVIRMLSLSQKVLGSRNEGIIVKGSEKIRQKDQTTVQVLFLKYSGSSIPCSFHLRKFRCR